MAFDILLLVTLAAAIAALCQHQSVASWFVVSVLALIGGVHAVETLMGVRIQKELREEPDYKAALAELARARTALAELARARAVLDEIERKANGGGAAD